MIPSCRQRRQRAFVTVIIIRKQYVSIYSPRRIDSIAGSARRGRKRLTAFRIRYIKPRVTHCANNRTAWQCYFQTIWPGAKIGRSAWAFWAIFVFPLGGGRWIFFIFFFFKKKEYNCFIFLGVASPRTCTVSFLKARDSIRWLFRFKY